MKAFYNGLAFTGSSFIEDAVMVEDGIVTGIMPYVSIPNYAELIDLKKGYLVPAFIDLQLYGGNGFLFSEYPSVASLAETYKYSLQGGATHILPTIATNSF